MAAGMLYSFTEEQRDQIKHTIPANKFGSIDNIAHAIDFLVNADYVTGTSIDINGGLL
jgi:NAD(P)-dependent dehydrogenase (short-subunit alcohol dehydrogenase family)